MLLFVLVPIRRSSSLSPSLHRARSLPLSPNRNNKSFAVIGPNEKFSNSHLYQLRQPIKDNSRIPKPREYAILGRNEKFQDNAIYPLRKPVVDDSSRVRNRIILEIKMQEVLNIEAPINLITCR